MLKGGRGYRQSTQVKEHVKARDNYTCQLCGVTKGDGAVLEADHVIPWAVNYDSTLGNFRCLCLQCNRATRRPRKDRALPVAEYDAWLRRELAACETGTRA